MQLLRFLVLAALAAPTASAAIAEPPTITVTMQSRFYAPDPIRLAAGQPVTLKLVNRDGSSHSFGARRFFRTARILSGDAPSGKLEVAPGQTATVTLVPAKGSYKVECSHHHMDKLGMQGRIIVE